MVLTFAATHFMTQANEVVLETRSYTSKAKMYVALLWRAFIKWKLAVNVKKKHAIQEGAPLEVNI